MVVNEDPGGTTEGRRPRRSHGWILTVGSPLFAMLVVALYWDEGPGSMLLWGWYAPVAFACGLWILRATRHQDR